MPVLGITGGIATGKSTFARALAPLLGAEIFDSDATARASLERDQAIREAVAAEFGADIYRPDQTLDRARLREMVFADPGRRAALENIVHPAVRRHWLALGESARSTGKWLLIDIPLLYETRAEVHLDRVIVVACSPQTQWRRLLNERALPPETAEHIVAAQLDLPTKINRADHLIWSDTPLACLSAQADLLVSWLTRHYGRKFQP